jgi:hypothetical protein
MEVLDFIQGNRDHPGAGVTAQIIIKTVVESFSLVKPPFLNGTDGMLSEYDKMTVAAKEL